MPWVFFVTKTDVSWAIVLFSVAFFGQQAWSTLVMTLPADLFPRRVVGSVAGLVGFGGAMGGVAFNYIAGEVLDRYKAADQLAEGYQVVFAMSSTFHVLAFVWILLMVRRVGARRSAAKDDVRVMRVARRLRSCLGGNLDRRTADRIELAGSSVPATHCPR